MLEELQKSTSDEALKKQIKERFDEDELKRKLFFDENKGYIYVLTKDGVVEGCFYDALQAYAKALEKINHVKKCVVISKCKPGFDYDDVYPDEDITIDVLIMENDFTHETLFVGEVDLKDDCLTKVSGRFEDEPIEPAVLDEFK